MVRNRIRLMHLALSTEESYCGWTGRYYDYCVSLPKQMQSEHKAESFLSYLAKNRGIAASTQNQAFSAILFLYKEVLGSPLKQVEAFRAKKPVHERVSPSKDQVRQLRRALEDTHHTPVRLIVDLLYGCGLRVSEPLELRIKDILWDEGPTGQLIIRGAKGGKDRRVPIPNSCVEPLKKQLEHAKAIWAWDRRNAPAVGVPLPFSLAVKYPSAPFAWQWFWAFPAKNHCTHPRENIQVRYHILVDSIQRAVKKASEQIGLYGTISPHCLRHAYATHSRERIDSLRILMGHSNIETTAGYLHPVINEASNPLDDMAIMKSS